MGGFIDSNGWIFHCHVEFSGGVPFRRTATPLVDFLKDNLLELRVLMVDFLGKFPHKKATCFFQKGERKEIVELGQLDL